MLHGALAQSGHDKGQVMKVCVAVCTRERPKLLRNCLESVCRQDVPDGITMDIVVVENDSENKSAWVADKVAAEFGQVIHYVLEPELGLPYVRNRCGTFAADNGYDWVLYIDDDEVAHPGWFATLMAAMQQYEADVYYARVIYSYLPETPKWMIPESENKRATGTYLKKAEGHNTLVHTRIFREDGFGLRFDGTMRFTGGSDTDFFTRVHDAGGKIVWIAEAIVEELVPANRMTLSWQLSRTFRVATNISKLHEKRAGRFNASLKSLLKGIGRLFNAIIVQLPACAIILIDRDRGKKQAFKFAKQAASALGSLSYFIGYQPQPYRKVDGS